MKLAHLTLIFATVAATAGCVSERSLAPLSESSGVQFGVSSHATEVPLLYVVDGVRLQRDQVPALSNDQVLSVSVMKGHLALQKFGPDAAYGVVVITTKAASVPQT
jgi:hypothetical protein